MPLIPPLSAEAQHSRHLKSHRNQSVLTDWAEPRFTLDAPWVRYFQSIDASREGKDIRNRLAELARDPELAQVMKTLVVNIWKEKKLTVRQHRQSLKRIHDQAPDLFDTLPHDEQQLMRLLVAKDFDLDELCERFGATAETIKKAEEFSLLALVTLFPTGIELTSPRFRSISIGRSRSTLKDMESPRSSDKSKPASQGQDADWAALTQPAAATRKIELFRKRLVALIDKGGTSVHDYATRFCPSSPEHVRALPIVRVGTASKFLELTPQRLHQLHDTMPGGLGIKFDGQLMFAIDELVEFKLMDRPAGVRHSG